MLQKTFVITWFQFIIRIVDRICFIRDAKLLVKNIIFHLSLICPMLLLPWLWDLQSCDQFNINFINRNYEIKS